MIAKMKKYQFLIFHKEYDAFLETLRDAGVFHVVEKQKGAADDAGLAQKMQVRSQLRARIALFERIRKAADPASLKAFEADIPADQDAMELLQRSEDRINEKERIQQLVNALQKEIEHLEVWGEFDPKRVHDLEAAGYRLSFYICPIRSWKSEWESLYQAMEIARKGTQLFFVTLTSIDAPAPAIDAERYQPGDASLSTLKAELSDYQSSIEVLDAELLRMAAQGLNLLEAAERSQMADIQYDQVRLSGRKEADEKLLLLDAWAPENRVKHINAILDQTGAWYATYDPKPGDDVPVLLQNNPFARLFEPIANLYMLPKYAELDLTPFFAPFFMLFFGLCLGDSGYGLLLFLIASGVKLFKKDLGKAFKAIMTLVQILGASTFIVGFLTGTFFGFTLYEYQVPILQRLKAAVFFDNNDMFMLSLGIGVVQILFAMILRVVNRIIQFGVVHALSMIGWVVLFLSIGFAVLFPGLLPLGGAIHLGIMGAAAVLIFFFNSPGKNPFLNVGLGLWDTYNMATGLMGDVLSYVRLFALGLSGGILGGVFNSLAVGMSPDIPVLGTVITLFIFLFGHAINLFMNTLGALVHPMRLTFVEFYKNSGFEGGAPTYTAFSKQK